MVLQDISPGQICIKKLRIHHARHQSPIRFPVSTNVGHKPSQVFSTLEGFGSCDLQVFAEAKPSIQLHPQVLDVCFPLDLMYPENDPRVLKGYPVRDEQSLSFFQGPFSGLCYPNKALPETHFH